MCKHDIADLVGTADGIICRACGKKFKSFAEINQAVDVEKTDSDGANTEDIPKDEEIIDKPAKVAKTGSKGAKTTKSTKKGAK